MLYLFTAQKTWHNIYPDNWGQPNDRISRKVDPLFRSISVGDHTMQCTTNRRRNIGVELFQFHLNRPLSIRKLHRPLQCSWS